LEILGVFLHNIRSFEAGAVVFDPEGVNLLLGENGSGKTTVFMAIRFALFGLRRGQAGVFEEFEAPTKESLLRAGAPRGLVRVLFRAGGGLYLVERVLTESGDMGGALYGCSEAGGSISCSSPKRLSATDLTSEVARAIGLPPASDPGRVFALASYSPQFLAHMILAGGRDRLAAIEAALGLYRFEAAKESAKRIAGSGDLSRLRTGESTLLGAEIKRVEDAVNRLRAELSRYGSREELERRLKQAEESIPRIEGEVKKVEAELASIDEESKRLRERAAQLTALVERARVLGEQVARLRERVERAAGKVSELTGGRDPAGVLAELSKELEGLEGKLRSLEAEAEAADALLLEARGRRERAAARVEALSKRLGEAEELARKGVCPVCGREIDHKHAEDMVKGLRAELAAAEEELSRCVADAAEAERRKRSAHAELKRVQAEVEGLRKRLEELGRAASELESAQGELSRAEEELRKLGASSASEELGEVSKRLEELEARRRELVEALKRLSASLEAARAAAKDAREKLSRVDEVLRELARQEQVFKRSAALYQLVGRDLRAVLDEASRIVRERSAETLRQELERFFGALFEGYEVSVGDDLVPRVVVKAGGRAREVRQPSGAEEVALALALRLAVNKAVRRFNPSLQRLPLLLDEPTYGFSETRVKNLAETLKKILSSEGIQVIIATHDEKLKGIAGHRITLSRLPTTATRVEYETDLDEEYIRSVEAALTRVRSF